MNTMSMSARRTRGALGYAALSAFLSMLPSHAATEQADLAKPVFTDSEIEAIVSHGPWPAAPVRDPTNRVSGKPDAIEFGTRLFFDQRLSGAGQVSCGTCHVPERNWTDNLQRSIGIVEVDRNTPTLMNLRGSRWYGWDGASDSLWSQNLRPLVDKRELDATPRHIAQVIRSDEQLACRYKKAFGAAASATEDEALFVNVGKALASFVETLVSGRTPFDNFRDAVARGQPITAGTYSEPAQRGLKIFIGKGNCTTCHSGPNFTSGEFFATGMSRFEPLGKADPGRPDGVRQLLESRFNLLGAFNDDVTETSAAHTREALRQKGTAGEFKVPSLRNLVLTAPYGRDGSVETVADVVRHYSSVDPVRLHARDGSPAAPLKLTAREQTDLVVFLESLSTFTNPWRPDDGGRCVDDPPGAKPKDTLSTVEY
jgi:cytochrome c peroxidase